MNPLMSEETSSRAASTQQQPPSYEQFTSPPQETLYIETGLTANQLSSYQKRPASDEFCQWLFAADKVRLHLCALWLLWFVTFVVACAAMGKANGNERRIDDYKVDTDDGSSAGLSWWDERCLGLGTALYGDDASEFAGHHYQLVGGDWAAITFRDAEYDAWGRCYGGRAGHLASIHSVAENEFIRSLLVNAPGYVYGDTAWIGGSDMAHEGTFVWLSDNRVFYKVGEDVDAYSNFAVNEPNNAFGSEDCVSMSHYGDWNDDSCYRTLPFFVVEFDA
mmetsp:Transcript_18620/g.57252  ORF Transcript_18620/g.57252 Transcript_18620/m.57252 type:complete len:277 (+) Transcript_18620:108-938(+)